MARVSAVAIRIINFLLFVTRTFASAHIKERKYSRKKKRDSLQHKRDRTIHQKLLEGMDRCHGIMPRAGRCAEESIRQTIKVRNRSEELLQSLRWTGCDPAQVKRKDAKLIQRAWWPGLEQWRAAAPEQAAATQKPKAAQKTERQDRICKNFDNILLKV